MEGEAGRPALIGENTPAGQSLVEFTLMVSVLMILLMGVLDIGRVYFTFLAMQDAAGEGASFAALYPAWRTNADQPDPNNITYRVKNSAPTGTLVDWPSATVTVTGGTTAGSLITVTVTANFQLLTPFVGALVGSQTLPLRARSVVVVVR